MQKAPKISLQGKHVRKGRPPKWLTYSFDQCAANAFDIAGAFMQYARENWHTFTHAEKVSTLQVAAPIALKRVPDKQEIIQITLNTSPEDMSRLLSLAENNLKRREALANHGAHAVTVEAQAKSSAPNAAPPS